MRPKDWVPPSLDACQCFACGLASLDFTVEDVLAPPDLLNVLSGHDVETLEHSSRSSSSSDVRSNINVIHALTRDDNSKDVELVPSGCSTTYGLLFSSLDTDIVSAKFVARPRFRSEVERSEHEVTCTHLL